MYGTLWSNIILSITAFYAGYVSNATLNAT